MALITKLSTCVIGENAVISTEGSSTSGTGRYSIEYEFKYNSKNIDILYIILY